MTAIITDPILDFPLDEYLNRLRSNAARVPTCDVLAELHHAQTYTIPFENLDLCQGRSRSLAPADLVSTLIRQMRGGYCYELNGLFALAARRIGFTVRCLMARNLMRPEIERQKTHMCLLVEAQGRQFLCDLGFGVWGPTEPVPLQFDSVFRQGDVSYKLVRAEFGIRLLCLNSGGWTELYECTLERVPQIDFEIVHYYNSTAPNSPYVTKRLVSLPKGNVRRTLNDRTYSEHSTEGSVRTVVDSDSAIETLLASVFGLRLADSSR